jgi:hypothetical protein
MAAWIQATPSAEAIDAFARALHWTGYLPETMWDELHTRVAAEVLVRELHALGYEVIPSYVISPSVTASGAHALGAVPDVVETRKGA